MGQNGFAAPRLTTIMSTHRRKSSTGPSSPGPLYLTFDVDPTAPAYKTVQTTLANGKTTQGRVCEICERVIPIGSKGSLHAFNTHKSVCERKNGSSTGYRLEDRAGSVPAMRSTPSLSPLMIPSSTLAPSLSGSPTPLSNSPIFSPIHHPLTSYLILKTTDLSQTLDCHGLP